MKKATAISPSNIAFIKYWGRNDHALRLPQNSSFSLNLDSVFSTCTIEFSPDFKNDDVSLIDENGTVSNKPHEVHRIIEVLDRVRKLGNFTDYAKVVSANNFPKGTGIASSASGLSAVTAAALWSAEISVEEKELSRLARLASGSACRSVPDGFVMWEKGVDDESSYAYSVFPPDHWKLCDVVCIVGKKGKDISSVDGQEIADTSPLQKTSIAWKESHLPQLVEAVKEKNFVNFGNLLELDAMILHSVCLTCTPRVIYWLPETIALMQAIVSARDAGLQAYFTIDAGPNIHLICEEKSLPDILKFVQAQSVVKQHFVCRPSVGTRPSTQHLF